MNRSELFIAGRALGLTLALAATASTQSSLWEIPPTGFQFGSALASLGDLDGDGIPDLAVGTWSIDEVALHSGADGSLLLTLNGPVDSHFGESLAGLGDVNGDGVPDLAIGAPWVESSDSDPLAGQLSVVSGADGSLIWSDEGNLPQDQMGRDVLSLGDVTLDGIDDVAYTGSIETAGGTCFIADGASGAILATLTNVLFENLNLSLAGGADVDGDGVPDLATLSNDGQDVLSVWSGASLAAGQPVTLFQRPTVEGFFRADFADVSGDERAEVLLGDPYVYPNGVSGRVLVLGDQGQVLDEYTGQPGQVWFGRWLRTLGDVDGDGRDDVAIRSTSLVGLAEDGHVSLVSGATGALLANSRGGSATSLTRIGDLDGDGRADLLATWSTPPFTPPSSNDVRATSSRQGAVQSVGSGCAPVGTPPPQLWAYGEGSPGGLFTLLATGPVQDQTVWVGIGGPTPPLTLPSGCQVHVAPILALVPTALSTPVPGVGFGSNLVLELPATLSAVTLAVQVFSPGEDGLGLSAGARIELVD